MSGFHAGERVRRVGEPDEVGVVICVVDDSERRTLYSVAIKARPGEPAHELLVSEAELEPLLPRAHTPAGGIE